MLPIAFANVWIGVIVNVELAGALARIHRDEMLAEARIYRLLERGHVRRAGSVRATLARATRALGYAALTLSDALAESS
jgi:hypothetical protein